MAGETFLKPSKILSAFCTMLTRDPTAIFLLLSLLADRAFAFVVRPLVGCPTGPRLSLCQAANIGIDSAEVIANVATFDQAPSLVISDVLDVVKNVAIVVGGIIAVILALTVVFSTYVIPAAAKQLEESTKELDPDLWDEYASKMEPGETLAMRADLMQELGQKMNNQIARRMDEMGTAMEANQSPDKPSDVSNSDVIDAEVLPADNKKSST